MDEFWLGIIGVGVGVADVEALRPEQERVTAYLLDLIKPAPASDNVVPLRQTEHA